MEKIYTKARAKINLYLEVLNKRPDNYHNIKSIFQKINLYDEIFIKKANDFSLKTNIKELNNSKNIIYKTYIKLKEKFTQITGVHVIINKKIPIQAGLAGGSTDCASFILAMNKLFNLKMSKAEIEILGKELGADVVPCLYKGAIIAEGIGNIITPIDSNFKYYIIIIKPQLSCNTKEMYSKIDERGSSLIINNSESIINGIRNHDINMISNNLYNVFEEVCDKEIITKIKKELNIHGATGTLMSGSGSCIFRYI